MPKVVWKKEFIRNVGMILGKNSYAYQLVTEGASLEDGSQELANQSLLAWNCYDKSANWATNPMDDYRIAMLNTATKIDWLRSLAKDSYSVIEETPE